MHGETVKKKETEIESIFLNQTVYKGSFRGICRIWEEISLG